MSFSKQDIEELKRIVPIGTILDSYLKLIPSGHNYKALCPFHNEKTPSFHVNTQGNFWYCFGCKKHGDIFTFIQDIEKLTFPQAVKFIAEKVNYKLQNDVKDTSDLRIGIYRVNKEAMFFYKKNLNSNNQPYRYLRERGLSLKTISDFSLGYALDSWNSLMNYLIDQGFSKELILEAGLIIEKGGRYYDRFRDRVIFPIIDMNENIVGFGGRIIGKGEPKYLNSPETLVFKKRALLYGINKARTHIRENNRAIITEGYMDVIMAHQSGVSNTIATLGTALTEEHLILTARYADEVIMLFDGDEPGIKAAMNSIEILLRSPLISKIVTLPAGQDLCDYLSVNPYPKLVAMLERAPASIDFFMNRILTTSELSTIEMRIDVAKKIFNLFLNLDSNTKIDYYLNILAGRLFIDFESLKKDFIKFRRSQHRYVAGKHREELRKVNKSSLTKEHIFERRLITIFFSNPDYFDPVYSEIIQTNYRFQDELSRDIFNNLVELRKKGYLYLEEMLKILPSDEIRGKIEKEIIIGKYKNISINDTKKVLYSSVIEYLKARIETEKIRLLQAEKSDDDELKRKALAEISLCTYEKQKMQNAIKLI